MEHTAKGGVPKIVKQCTLPLTGKRCVHQIITELCVLELDAARNRFVLTELAPGVSLDDVKKATEAEFFVAPSLREISL
jgi:acyl CoA:acetate/3-ketoacid CoA transferase beta subunit